MDTVAIILAGGSGERLPGSLPKQFLEIGGRTLLEICLERFQNHAGVDGIVLVCPAPHRQRAEEIAAAFSRVVKVTGGGRRRQESSAIGVGAVPAAARNILIHDAARALVPAGVIGRVLAALKDNAAVMPVVPVRDTIVRLEAGETATAVLDREMFRRVQTPQGFRSEVIRQAHELAAREGFVQAGDDCSLVLRYGLAPVVTVAGDAANIKVTAPPDMELAEALLRQVKSKA